MIFFGFVTVKHRTHRLMMADWCQVSPTLYRVTLVADYGVVLLKLVCVLEDEFYIFSICWET